MTRPIFLTQTMLFNLHLTDRQNVICGGRGVSHGKSMYNATLATMELSPKFNTVPSRKLMLNK